MRRRAWAMIRNGEMADYFYLRDEPITPDSFYKPEEVQIVGPFNVEAPPPPTDMVPMTRTIWLPGRGYVEVPA